MYPFILAIIKGITAFIATNVDDFLVLVVFFLQVNASFQKFHIVMGAYLGFSLIVILSLLGSVCGFILPSAAIGVLGVLPIYLGVKELFRNNQEPELSSAVVLDLLKLPVRIPWQALLSRILPPQVFQVAAITLANGGDNIGVYIPLFASHTVLTSEIILIVFFLMVGVWCYLSYRLTKNVLVARNLTRYAQKLFPYVLIILGFTILWEKGTLTLLFAYLGH